MGCAQADGRSGADSQSLASHSFPGRLPPWSAGSLSAWESHEGSESSDPTDEAMLRTCFGSCKHTSPLIFSFTPGHFFTPNKIGMGQGCRKVQARSSLGTLVFFKVWENRPGSQWRFLKCNHAECHYWPWRGMPTRLFQVQLGWESPGLIPGTWRQHVLSLLSLFLHFTDRKTESEETRKLLSTTGPVWGLDHISQLFLDIASL